MVWFCAVGCAEGATIRGKNSHTTEKSTMTTDFRKADPTYVNFTCTTAEEAIDKFYRHRNLGVPPHLWPEVFVECSAKLPPTELGKFEAWLVNPNGENLQPPRVTPMDIENERERQQLLAEATARDLSRNVIHEHFVEDEKSDVKDVDECELSNLSLTKADFEMVNLS